MTIFVVGNVAIDETLSVDAFPAPGASILAVPAGSDLGGKGANQAVVLSRCGMDVHLTAPIGADDAAGEVKRVLTAERLSTTFVVIAGRTTDRSIILRAPSGENLIVTTAQAAEGFPAQHAADAIETARAGDVVLLQGNLTDKVTRAVFTKAQAQGAMTVFNPSPVRPTFCELLPLCDLVVANAKEAEALTGVGGRAALDALCDQGAGKVIITLGSEGAILKSSEGVISAGAVAATPVDTTGAGDTFLGAMLASAISRHAFDALALHHGAAAAALTVSRPGAFASLPGRAEVEAILGETASSELRR